jgi:hypothetical protein
MLQTVNGQALAEQFIVRTRGKHQRKDEATEHTAATPLEAVDLALRCTHHPADSEPVAWWEGTDQLASADADFHGERKFAERDLRSAGFIEPYPLRLWVSHGGGVKTVHTAVGVLDADEAAALWLLGFLSKFGQGGCTGVEVKSSFFLPWYSRDKLKCSEVEERDFGSSDSSEALGRLLGGKYAGADEGARDSWLAENGLELSRTYPHNVCPIDPAHASHGDPVWMGEFGVYCHSCDARGVVHPGCRRAGFVPYGVLAGRGGYSEPGLVRSAAWGWVHFDQAQYYMRHEGVPDKLAELVYRAAVKAVHAGELSDPERKEPAAAKLDGVFRGRSTHMVNVDGGVWVESDDLRTVVGRGLAKRVKGLPALLCTNHKGRIVISDGPRAGRLLDGQNLNDLGYFPLTVLHGVDMWGGRLSSDPTVKDGKVRAVSEADPPFRRHPGYTLAQAKEHVSRQFPGINFAYLDLLLFAKAFAQRGLPEPPTMYVVGQSASGKTQTIHLAGEIGLCPVTLVNPCKDEQRFRQQIGAAARRSDIILMDEITKKHPDLLPSLEGMILEVKGGMPYHELYVGTRKVNSCPAIVLADTDMLPWYRCDIQTARRTILVELGAGCVGQKDWRTTCSGGTVHGWRKAWGEFNLAAADTYLAHAVERVRGFDTFQAAAASLGFRLMSEKADDCDPNFELKVLFKAVCEATPAEKDTNFKGPGWVVFRLDDSSHPVRDAWIKCVGEREQDRQRMTAAQWGVILGVPGVEMDIHDHGRRRGVRFRLGPVKVSGTRYNAGIRVDLSKLIDLDSVDSTSHNL